MLLPDDTIRGTRRHHFEVHDLSDVSGGKWKAVHIPDEEISSMLKMANGKKVNEHSLDIEHEQFEKSPKFGEIKVPVEVHGRVHAFDNTLLQNSSHNSSRPVGNLIVAMENEERSKETHPLYSSASTVIQLRGKEKTKEEEPKTREIAAKTPRRPSLIVAKIPDGDDLDEELPLQESMHNPIVASLRKSPRKFKDGAMRSEIDTKASLHSSAGFARNGLSKSSSGAWLDKILAQVKLPSFAASLRKSLSMTRDGALRNDILPRAASKTSPQTSPDLSMKNISDQSEAEDKSKSNKNVGVLEKIKSLLLKSHSKPKDSPAVPFLKSAPTPTLPLGAVKETGKSQDTPLVLNTTEKTEGEPLSSLPYAKDIPTQNSNGLFAPILGTAQDAFSNHADALNRISSTKKEALLVGIIKALLSRGKSRAGPDRLSTLPHYNKQAILQGIQRLQMQRTLANAQKNGASPGIDTGDPVSSKNLDEFYQKQRESLVNQELGRANEETLEARKMRQQESTILSNYDHFSNPETEAKWRSMSPKQSRTGDGQTISLMGPQQLNMVEENLSDT